MEHNAEEKMAYLQEVVLPELRQAFERGDKQYVGAQHSHCPRVLARGADEDVRHVRECHVAVRLAEAEDAADGGDLEKALSKIESAMGYLTILHLRVRDKFLEQE